MTFQDTVREILDQAFRDGLHDSANIAPLITAAHQAAVREVRTDEIMRIRATHRPLALYYKERLAELQASQSEKEKE